MPGDAAATPGSQGDERRLFMNAVQRQG